MKNRNIQFKATAGLVAPLLLSCSMAVFTLTPSPALGDDHQENSQPFTGTVSGTIPEDLGPPVPGTGGCVFNFFVPNSGNANLLGNFTGTPNFIPNLCDGSYTGTFDWAAANGDRIFGSFLG